MSAQRNRPSDASIALTAAARIAAAAVFAIALAAAPRGAEAADAPAPRSAAQIELQVGLCAPAAVVTRALALKAKGQPLDVWFFDDATLALLDRGVRLRLRVTGAGGVLTLKVAEQDCARLAPDLVPRGEGKCEYDRHGDRIAGAVSLERELDAKAARQLVAGAAPVVQALSPAQIRYLREIVGVWPLPAGVRPLGPVGLQRYRAAGRPWDVDVWAIPGGGGNVEISRKVPTAEGDRAYQELRDEVLRAGIALCADQSAQSANTLRALLPAR